MVHRLVEFFPSDGREQFGVIGKLGGVDEGEALGPLVRASDDEPGDLHDLPVTAGRGPRVLTRGFEMPVRFACVTRNAGHHREQRVVDWIHVARFRLRAYSPLTGG